MTPEQKMRAVSEHMPELAKMIDEYLDRVAVGRVSFSLVVFTFPRLSYVSNTKNREEIAGVLQTLIDGWKNGMPDIKAHEVS